MPKIRTSRTKARRDAGWPASHALQQPPEGFDEIESVLDDYARKMRDGTSRAGRRA